MIALAVASYILVALKPMVIEADNPNVIESHSFEYYQVKRSEEIAQNCEIDEMLAYGLSGDALKLSERNTICPHIARNCCGVQDQARIWQYWHRDRKRQEYYHISVLKLVKYFLGYGREWYRMASAVMDDYEEKVNGMKKNGGANENVGQTQSKRDKSLSYTVGANRYCYEAAKFIVRLDFNEKSKAETYYRIINEKTEFMENARKSFYCVFCSVEGQKAVSTWYFPKAFSNIQYNMGFCQMMVNNTFRINYELYNTYNLYLSNLMKMSMCVSAGDQTGTPAGNYKSFKPPVAISKEQRNMIEDPLGNRNWLKFLPCQLAQGVFGNFACITYCSQFNIAKPKPAIDFDVHALKRIYDRMVKYESVLSSARNNFYNDDMNKMKQEINYNYMKTDKSVRFFKTLVHNIDVAEYIVNFAIVSNGMNPMEIARGTPLPINYKCATVPIATVLLVLVGWLLAKYE